LSHPKADRFFYFNKNFLSHVILKLSKMRDYDKRIQPYEDDPQARSKKTLQTTTQLGID